MNVTVVVLAGGRGRRIGGEKAVVPLAGRPLIAYPLAAAAAAGLDAIVVAKRGTRLPALEVPVLLEPDTPTHPLLGVSTALERFAAVLALPCDMPFVAPADLVALAAQDAPVAILAPAQPFPALYRRSALDELGAAVRAGASVRSTQARAAVVSGARGARGRAAAFTVNSPEDLAEAERVLSRR